MLLDVRFVAGEAFVDKRIEVRAIGGAHDVEDGGAAAIGLAHGASSDHFFRAEENCVFWSRRLPSI